MIIVFHLFINPHLLFSFSLHAICQHNSLKTKLPYSEMSGLASACIRYQHILLGQERLKGFLTLLG